MARTPDGPPPPPAVQKLRLRYARRARLRFSSHRDFQRALERALRRAGVPMAYSAGFSPHPKISYLGSAPTGAASEAEYVEISLAARVDPARLRAAVDAALPPGLDLLDAVEAGPGALADRLTGSVWRVWLPEADDAATADAVGRFLAGGPVEVERIIKNGRRVLDVTTAVVDLSVLSGTEVDEDGAADVLPGSDRGGSRLRLVLRHLTPVVRADDVLTGLAASTGLVLPQPPQTARLRQGPLDDEPVPPWVGDPLAPDREAVPVL